MKCPWLIKTVTQTSSIYKTGESTKTEHQEFDKCLKEECPFYVAPTKTVDHIILNPERCKRV